MYFWAICSAVQSWGRLVTASLPLGCIYSLINVMLRLGGVSDSLSAAHSLAMCSCRKTENNVTGVGVEKDHVFMHTNAMFLNLNVVSR